jgi:hypothetical protein
MSMTQTHYDPRGLVEADSLAAAARAPTLKGKRVAILDNTKWNAGKLLRNIRDGLSKEAGIAAITYYRKHSFSMNAATALLDEIAADNDLVITAIGD